MTNTGMELPVKEHSWLVQSRVNQTQEHYALVTVPRILSKTILGWAEEYVERGEGKGEQAKKFAEYCLNDLIERVQKGHFVEDLVIAEGVAERYIDQCVERIQAFTLGVQA